MTEPSLSYWAQKPRWCQPWSIVATGTLISLGSWWWLHRWWLTLPVSFLVLLWWGLFLVLAPMASRETLLSEAPQAEGGNDAETGSPPLR